MYAIIATGGKQYKVSEGDVIKVEKLGVAEGETVITGIDNILRGYANIVEKLTDIGADIKMVGSK